MDWTVYNFECDSVEARERFVEYFSAEHPVSFPEEDTVAHEAVYDESGEECSAEYAWVSGSEYLYLTSLSPVDGLLSTTADYWDRAVSASFDSTTESCIEATLYESDGDAVAEVASWDGVPERGGSDVLWRCAAEYDFRFRAYSANPPTTILHAPITSAFEFVPPENIEEFVSEMARETGVEPTQAGIDFLLNDPARDGGDADVDVKDVVGPDRSVNRISVDDPEVAAAVEAAIENGDEAKKQAIAQAVIGADSDEEVPDRVAEVLDDGSRDDASADRSASGSSDASARSSNRDRDDDPDDGGVLSRLWPF